MATIPVINLPESPGLPPPIPSFSFNDADALSTFTETTQTTVKITPDSDILLPAAVPGGSPRRRSLIEIETITESYAFVPPKSPTSPVAGGLAVPEAPVSHRRRISVVQWRDIKTSLFNKDIKFEEADPQVTPFLSRSVGLSSIEDTFWAGKKKLIPMYDKMEMLDQFAINVSYYNL